MAIETTHSLLVSLNLALSPWPRYPERQSPCQRLKFCISFPKEFSRWVLLLSEMGTFKPLYTHSQRDAHTEYPLSCVTKGRDSWEGRQLGDKNSKYLLSRVLVVMEVLSLLISRPVSPCPSWFSSHCPLGLTCDLIIITFLFVKLESYELKWTWWSSSPIPMISKWGSEYMELQFCPRCHS